MEFFSDNMTVPSYVVYRENPSDLSFPPVFFPPKDSDELFDALREKYPNRRTHSERMRDAVIEFLLEERNTMEQVLSASSATTTTTPLTTTNTSPWQQSWPSMSSATSTLSSPETAGLATPTFGNSPPVSHHYPLERSTSSATAANTSSPPDIENMTSVFSLSSSTQPKQRVRRKMTEAEKVEYRKRRQVKACEKCSKRKRKCIHNQPEMDEISTPSSNRVVKCRASEPLQKQLRTSRDGPQNPVRIADSLKQLDFMGAFTMEEPSPAEDVDFSYLLQDPTFDISFDDPLLFDDQPLWLASGDRDISDLRHSSTHQQTQSLETDNRLDQIRGPIEASQYDFCPVLNDSMNSFSEDTMDASIARKRAESSNDFFEQVIQFDNDYNAMLHSDDANAKSSDLSQTPLNSTQRPANGNNSIQRPLQSSPEDATTRADATHTKHVHEASMSGTNGNRNDTIATNALMRGSLSRVNPSRTLSANANSFSSSSRALDHLLGFIPEMKPFLAAASTSDSNLCTAALAKSASHPGVLVRQAPVVIGGCTSTSRGFTGHDGLLQDLPAVSAGGAGGTGGVGGVLLQQRPKTTVPTWQGLAATLLERLLRVLLVVAGLCILTSTFPAPASSPVISNGSYSLLSAVVLAVLSLSPPTFSTTETSSPLSSVTKIASPIRKLGDATGLQCSLGHLLRRTSLAIR